ncbi:alpha/beta hydrolase [Pseudonocardia broussonetiae]|uniref:Alpha/beta hydrolase n=1 Tax=Pseudonocardia broussonetiae TaxID=2736640 RepID=A0A6M6JH43_9PSEU|nr:alpha/beta hydrolase [Pseudonocardia broussonetiae]QJY46786.1 alpha/beta hydrolase [Pseudonocardia broussonetiae]
MTLDAQARGLLDAMAAQGAKDFAEMTVPEAREMGMAFIDLQGEPEVAEVTDTVVPGPAGEIPVRVYRTAGDGPKPVILYFHGGGWVIGSIEVADKPCRLLATIVDAVVVSVGYRKAPEDVYPAAPDDCYAATAWVAEHASELGVDATRLVVAGDSAGGNLAAAVTLMARDRGGPAIAHQLLIYPAVDAGGEYVSRVENGEGYLLTKSAMDWFYSHYLSSPTLVEDPYVSPLRAASHADLPPATVITAGFDPLRDEGDAYAAALSGAGVPVTHLQNPSMIHGFWWLAGAIGHTRGSYEEAGAAVRAALAV